MDDKEQKAIEFVSRGEGVPFIAHLAVQGNDDVLEVAVHEITPNYVVIERWNGDMSYREIYSWQNIEFLRTKKLEPKK